MRVLTASAVAFLTVLPVFAQPFCERETQPPEATVECPAIDPPPVQPDAISTRLLRYAQLEPKHRLCGLASYYSTSLDGTLTATGEIFHQRDMTAAHLTLPLGTWVEVRARATGRKVRLLVNDRGPYVKKFCLDLSQAAAHALGVDVAEDRHVDIRILALPGEIPLSDGELTPGRREQSAAR
jgi:rare lipoprotein A